MNVPLGRIKSRDLNTNMLTEDMMAVYYAAYRHLAKMALRDGFRDTQGNFLSRVGTVYHGKQRGRDGSKSYASHVC